MIHTRDSPILSSVGSERRARATTRAGRKSPYKTGCHPNSRRNLKPFTGAVDPRRFTGGASGPRKRASDKLAALGALLESDVLDEGERLEILLRCRDLMLLGALEGDPHVMAGLFEGAMRGWW